uniref:Glycosyltransferase n=1 Tax=viral metagenome TaxID=1070528 RepID=A0A6C0J4G8_9ZZZZ
MENGDNDINQKIAIINNKNDDIKDIDNKNDNIKDIDNKNIKIKKEFYDLIISINVHKDINFLVKQLENIDKYVKLKYLVILNCNKLMAKKFKKHRKLFKNFSVIIHPKPFNKKKGTGTLLKGIFMNLTYSKITYNFNYFLILTSRTIFYNILNKENIKHIKKKKKRNTKIGRQFYVKNNKLIDHIKKRKGYYSSGASAGIVLNKKNYTTVINFLTKYPNIRDNLFSLNVIAEEFALQTICINYCKYYFYIGNGIKKISNIKDLNKLRKKGNFVCKIKTKICYFKVLNLV